MAFKTFAPGVLTSSDVNTFLMRQTIITCTSSTRPASPSEGMTIYETDTDKYRGYTGSAWKEITDLGDWISYTPTLSGGTSDIGNGTLDGNYKIIGAVVHFRIRLDYGSTTVFDASDVFLSLPVATLGGTSAFGTGFINDTSTGINYGSLVLLQASTTTVNVLAPDPSNAGRIGKVRSGFPLTWDSGDAILISGTYRRSA